MITRIRSATIVFVVGILLFVTALSGCTSSTNTSPQASPATATAIASGVPSSASVGADTATWVTGVTPTSNGYIVKGKQFFKPSLALNAGTYTFHIMLKDFTKGMSGQAFLTGSTGLVQLVVFTDPNWGADMTITKDIPVAGNYTLTVSYLNNWEVDISQ